jgi:hypothetical protein
VRLIERASPPDRVENEFATTEPDPEPRDTQPRVQLEIVLAWRRILLVASIDIHAPLGLEILTVSMVRLSPEPVNLSEPSESPPERAIPWIVI